MSADSAREEARLGLAEAGSALDGEVSREEARAAERALLHALAYVRRLKQEEA